MSNIYPGGDAQYSTNLGLSLWGADEVVVENFLLIDAAVGGGSSVKVNGVTVSNPNFNGTTPTAPGGNTNITFQVLGSSVSAYVPTTVAGVTSITGDSVVYNNAASTGAVTLSLISQVKNTFLGGPTTGSNATPTFRALVAADIPSLPYGTGTVTSVAMTGDGVVFNSTVSGSPIITSGTLAPSLLTQTANTILAGPTSAGPTAPTFRSLVSGDIPALPYIPTSLMTTLGDTIYGGASGVATRLAGQTTTTKMYLSQTGAAGPVSAAPIWAQIAIGDLANIAGGTVLGNTATTAGAVAATTAPVLGIPGTSTGTIALASSTASGKFTITAPASAATPTLTLSTSSGVAVNVADGTIFTATIGASGTLALATQAKNTFLVGPASGSNAAPTFRVIGAGDIPSGTVTWDQIGNAAASLTLSNAG